MTRLIVQAVTDEHRDIDDVGDLRLLISVSRANNGKPVTGLGLSNFRIILPDLGASILSSSCRGCQTRLNHLDAMHC